MITNNLQWSAATTAELYKRRWQIEIFFKIIKQNIQIKIFIAMITYLLRELIRRNISKTYHCFGHFVTLIRVCLTQYNRLEYIVNEMKITVQKAKNINDSPQTVKQKLALG